MCMLMAPWLYASHCENFCLCLFVIIPMVRRGLKADDALAVATCTTSVRCDAENPELSSGNSISFKRERHLT